jgi:CRP-like cAMP-binding protein
MTTPLLTEKAKNHLLSRLPTQLIEPLLANSQTVPLRAMEVLYEARARVRYAYFPIRGIISALAVMRDGGAIEVTTVGDEGMVYLPSLLDSDTAMHRIIVQGEGEAIQVEVDWLRAELKRNDSLRALINRYHLAYLLDLSQTIACNGLHTLEKRCCRWLLLSQTRMKSSELPFTHEFLSMMLGVRRPSVTDVLQSLQERGFISAQRGKIVVLDREGLERTSCECYRTVREEFERILGTPA